MAKTEVIKISADTQKNIDLLNGFKSQVDEIGNNCRQIQIVDESTLSVGQQNMSKANSMLTMIDANIKAIRKPLNDQLTQISAIGNPLKESLESGIKHLKDEVSKYEKERLAIESKKQAEIDRKLREEQNKVAAETKRKQDIRDYISQKAQPLLETMYVKCVSAAICDEKLLSIEKNYKPKEFFSEFATEAYELRDRYINLIKAKKEQLLQAGTLSDGEKSLAAEKEKLELQRIALQKQESDIKAREEANRLEKERLEKEQQAEEERQKLILEAATNKTKGIRHTWAFELVDKTLVDPNWLMLDDAAVKSWMKENKDRLKDGDIFCGVRFFKTMGVVA